MRMTVSFDVNDGEDDKKQKRKALWTQYGVTLVVNLGALSIGSLLGWTSQAVPKLKSENPNLHLTESQLSWVAGCMPLGAAFASLPVPVIMKYTGRKWTLLLMVPVSVLGFGLLAWASDNQMKEAEKSLRFFRGNNPNVTEELESITKFVNESKGKKLSLELFKSKATIKSILIAFWLMVFQQFGGANAVVFNTTTIYQEAGSSLEPEKATMIVGLMQFGGNFLSMLLIEKLGRRILLLLSGSAMGTCTLILGLYFHWLKNNENVDNLKWLPLVSLSFFIIMFSIGWGPVAWMMLGELFPTEIKSVASSFCCATNWMATFLVTKYFGDLVSAFGQDVTFWIFTVISAAGIGFVYFSVPETKGKTLEEIQRNLMGAENKGFAGET